MTDDARKKNRIQLVSSGVLTEALPFMQRYNGQTVVVKYGGAAMGDAALSAAFASDIVMLRQVGINVVVVHGGGPQIGAMLDKVGVENEFVNGLRVTTAEAIVVVEMVLSGQINKGIVADITAAGGRAVGLSGKDGGMIRVRKLKRPAKGGKRVDLGFVGEPTHIDASIAADACAAATIPVIAPIGFGSDGATYNINADTVAGAVAGALSASRLLLLTDVEGVLDTKGALVPELTVRKAKGLMKDGTLSGGMIPKVETCIESVGSGVEAAVILDGRIPHAILLEMFTEHGSGTLIRS